jgi:hypothetical protein
MTPFYKKVYSMIGMQELVPLLCTKILIDIKVRKITILAQIGSK